MRCLLKVFYFRVLIGLTVSHRIPPSTAKNFFFLPLCVKNAHLHQPSSIFKGFQISLFQQVFNFGTMKHLLLLLSHKYKEPLKTRRYIYIYIYFFFFFFFYTVESINKFFGVPKFDVIRVILPKGFDWFVRPFYDKGLADFTFGRDDPHSFNFR